MFRRIISDIIHKVNFQNGHRNQLINTKPEPKKRGTNLPEILNLNDIDYYPLPPAPSRWDSSPQNTIFPGKDLFEIVDQRKEQFSIAEVRKLSISERPDPAYKIIMPSSLGFIEIDKSGNVKNLPNCSSALSLRDKQGNLLKEIGLDYSIYRIGLDYSAKYFILMDKESNLHIFNEHLEEIMNFDLANDPRVMMIRESDVNFFGDVRTSIRCTDISNDGQSMLFTVADSAFLIDKSGTLIWARSMPLGEGWIREFVKGDRVGTSQEVFNALDFMKLALPVTREQINKRYRELSMEYHPDLNRHLHDHGEMMQTLNKHHEILTGMDSKELAKDPKRERITYRRTKPDSNQKFIFTKNNVSYELSIEASFGGPALDWIYAAAISNQTGGTYLGTYSGKVIKLDSYGKPEFALDVANVPREIIEVEQLLYILTDTRLYIVGQGQALINIIDVYGQGKLAVSREGFGLYSTKSLSWYTPTGAYKFSLGTKYPLRTFYFSGDYLVVETRQHRAFIAFRENSKHPSIEDVIKPTKLVINNGTGKLQAKKENEEIFDKNAPPNLANISSLKRSGRYKEAIEVLIREVEKQETQDKIQKFGVAPWAYHELAIIYRKQKDYVNEINILKRYMHQRKGAGVMPSKIADRLVKAQELLKRSQSNKE